MRSFDNELVLRALTRIIEKSDKAVPVYQKVLNFIVDNIDNFDLDKLEVKVGRIPYIKLSRFVKQITDMIIADTLREIDR